ncbi:chaperone modulator CbpM [Pedobacter sp. P351]|uniref:chaperone modulator CbpM n=1 Tax=Pedobacter superstes TaxID=3133441 RepID=UPI0030A2F234
MTTGDLIAANDFCEFHHIEYSFIGSLEEAGLVQLVAHENQKFIEKAQLAQLEKIIRLSQDLDINIAGIEVIIYLLSRLEHMEEEISSLKNKVSFYQEDTSNAITNY